MTMNNMRNSKKVATGIQQTQEFYELCQVQSITTLFDTESKFNSNYNDDDLSPIDLFITNTKEITKLLGNNYSPALGNLLLLGYISAAESYLRALIRRLINCDEHIRTLVSEKSVSYAAAYHHEKKLLPEALLEDFSFTNPHNIYNTLKELTGVHVKNDRNCPLKKPADEFKKVCELRHCCVHRFGKLGSKNALRLGLPSHSKFLEKPIILMSEDIDQIAFIVDTFIRSLNNYMYKTIMERTANNKNNKYYSDIEWEGIYSKDKKRFKSYYDIFCSQKDEKNFMEMKDAYNQFLLYCKKNTRPKT